MYLSPEISLKEGRKTIDLCECYQLNSAKKFVIEPGWQIIFKDLGISVSEVLTRAQLPTDLFSRPTVTLNSTEYFRFWVGLEATVKDPAFPLKLGQAVPVESFNPPLFATLCSPNLLVAMKRLSQFKRLVGPMTLDVTESETDVTLTVDSINSNEKLPGFLVATESVFLVHLIRLATREHIIPLKIQTQEKLNSEDTYTKYTNFFGTTPQLGQQNQITFSTADAQCPFLTKNESMWQFFEPELRRKLVDLDIHASFATRVESALLELLPTGQSSIEDVSNKLGVSKRTLQRRLQEESTSFKIELNQTREKLARYYLTNSTSSGGEISFLLGFDDPNSFFRAFHAWTGKTPESFRRESSQIFNQGLS